MDLVRNHNQEGLTISDILYKQAQEQPNKLAVIHKDKSYTYRELFCMALRLSKEIKENYNDAEKIGIVLDRSIHYIVSYFAVLMNNSVIVPIDPNLTLNEVRNTIDYCEVGLIISDSNFSFSDKDLNDINLLILDDSNLEYFEDMQENYNSTLCNNDVAVLLHTSGSTSNPKRVMLTHQSLISNAKSHALHLELTEKDRVLIILPMHFGYCNTAQIICHFLLGGTLVIMEGVFLPHKLFKLIDQYEITVFTAVPSMLLSLKDYNHFKKYNLSTLRQITYGGAPFPSERLEAIKKLFPNVSLLETYGLTEAGPRITAVSPSFKNPSIDSVGIPIPGVEVEIMLRTGEIADKDEIGEVIVRSEGMMKGYFKNPMETKKVIKNGWLYTGDLGYKSKTGELFIVGRIKNVIIRAGINIYPEEIETYMLKHEKVQSILVYGENSDIYGEVPKAKVVVTGGNVTVKELVEFAHDGLTKYKIPDFEIVTELPRTYNNKINRNKLKSGVVSNGENRFKFKN
ncbi:acyl--CoA ligase [Priestia filamentosa]|uniref:class I adenylate-forming enzyme family protein n=1 Tax=Priestia filamentosa TaxID=1402861 RepID=UPI001FB21C50|nr:class I adenylate-forming enzyme family protein [Priestia filamentosa]UOE58268.1 acyl--CoA ligase [Priestia filamentosa]